MLNILIGGRLDCKQGEDCKSVSRGPVWRLSKVQSCKSIEEEQGWGSCMGSVRYELKIFAVIHGNALHEQPRASVPHSEHNSSSGWGLVAIGLYATAQECLWASYWNEEANTNPGRLWTLETLYWGNLCTRNRWLLQWPPYWNINHTEFVWNLFFRRVYVLTNLAANLAQLLDL